MSLRKQGISATVWTTTSSIIKSLIQILRFSILARILEKEDFGVIAIVTLVLGFTQIFADLGVSVSLYSRKDISKKQYSSLLWVSVILSLLIYGVLAVGTPVVARFYEMEELNLLIPIMGLDLIFLAAGRQFRVFREKELRFKELAIIDIITSALSLILAYWLAINDYGVYSLVYSALFASFSASLVLIIFGIKNHPVLLYINFKENKSFYKVGFYQTGTQILDYFATQLDIILMGKLMSTADLGAYNLVKQLVLKIYRVINPIVTTVAVPLLATIKEDVPRFKEKFLQLLNIISLVNFSAYALVAILSHEVLLILYGSSYLDSSTILKILCCWGAFSGVGSVVSTLIIITGRTDIGFKRTIIRVIMNSALILIGAFYAGFLGIVVAQTAYSMMIFLINWKMIINKLMRSISFIDYSEKIVPYFILFLFSVFAIHIIEHNLFVTMHIVSQILLKIVLLIGLLLLFFRRTLFQAFAFVVKR